MCRRYLEVKSTSVNSTPQVLLLLLLLSSDSWWPERPSQTASEIEEFLCQQDRRFVMEQLRVTPWPMTSEGHLAVVALCEKSHMLLCPEKNPTRSAEPQYANGFSPVLC